MLLADFLFLGASTAHSPERDSVIFSERTLQEGGRELKRLLAPITIGADAPYIQINYVDNKFILVTKMKTIDTN